MSRRMDRTPSNEFRAIHKNFECRGNEKQTGCDIADERGFDRRLQPSLFHKRNFHIAGMFNLQ